MKRVAQIQDPKTGTWHTRMVDLNPINDTLKSVGIIVSQLAIIVGLIFTYLKSDKAKEAADTSAVHAQAASAEAKKAADSSEAAAVQSDANGRRLNAVLRGPQVAPEPDAEQPPPPKQKGRVREDDGRSYAPPPGDDRNVRRGTTRAEWNRRLKEAGLPELPPDR